MICCLPGSSPSRLSERREDPGEEVGSYCTYKVFKGILLRTKVKKAEIREYTNYKYTCADRQLMRATREQRTMAITTPCNVTREMLFADWPENLFPSSVHPNLLRRHSLGLSRTPSSRTSAETISIFPFPRSLFIRFMKPSHLSRRYSVCSIIWLALIAKSP